VKAEEAKALVKQLVDAVFQKAFPGTGDARPEDETAKEAIIELAWSFFNSEKRYTREHETEVGEFTVVKRELDDPDQMEEVCAFFSRTAALEFCKIHNEISAAADETTYCDTMPTSMWEDIVGLAEQEADEDTKAQGAAYAGVSSRELAAKLAAKKKPS
jgi:hypothetical protein